MFECIKYIIVQVGYSDAKNREGGMYGMRGAQETALKESSGNSGCTVLTSSGLNDPTASGG